MHIFDIRRSNSVTELWRRFEHNSADHISTEDDRRDAIPSIPQSVVHEDQHEAPTEAPASHDVIPPPVFDEPRPLMEAFEAELAEILNSAESSEKKSPQPHSTHAAEKSTNTNSERTPHPVELLAAQVMDQLMNGANMLQSEWRSRMPELQQQLQNAQRQFEAAQKSLPENVEVSLRTLLATLEAHMRSAFNNIPDGGRQMAEEAFQAGRPVAENAADGLRMMASEFNEVGKTLFAAFESEFGRAGLNSTSNNEPAAPGPAYPQTTAYSSNPAPTEKPTPGPSESKASGATAKFQGPSPLNTASDGNFHHTPHRQVLGHPNHWTPPPFVAPFWNTFQAYHAPPPPPPPPYIPHAPQQQSTTGAPQYPPWPQPHPSQWPQWRSAPTPSASNNSSQARHVPVGNTGQSQADPATKTLFIGNVGFKVTEKMIQDVFASKGFIVKVDLPMDTASGRHAGFGYVRFPSDHPAFAAMGALQGAIIDGHSINLEHMDHPPIERLKPVQNTAKQSASSVCDIQGPRAELSGMNNAASKRSSPTSEHIASPSATNATDSNFDHGKTFNRRKSVNFVGIAGDSASSKSQAESSALLDSPSDDPAFSARFPSLLPETGAQHNAPLNHQGPPSDSHAGAPELSRFPPVSQLEAQLLAGPSLTDSSEPHHAANMNRRATEYTPHHASRRHAANSARSNGLHHSVSMRHLGERSKGPTTTTARACVPRRGRTGSSSHGQIPGSFPAEQLSLSSTSTEPDVSRGSDSADVEECVSALVNMGYGTEHEGGRPRMAVYAAVANGNLMDAIDIIEEERRVYERRASQ
jgi:RNA recognition motif-containing protein